MAAGQKAVESTAAEMPHRRGRVSPDHHQDRSEKEQIEEASENVRREGHSQTGRSQTDHAGHSLRAEREDRSEKGLKEGLSVTARKEDSSVSVQREDRSATDRSQTGHAGHSLRAEREDSSERGLKEGLSETARKEDLSEKDGVSVTESRQDQDSIRAARASTRRISTTSATRSRAESAE